MAQRDERDDRADVDARIEFLCCERSKLHRKYRAVAHRNAESDEATAIKNQIDQFTNMVVKLVPRPDLPGVVKMPMESEHPGAGGKHVGTGVWAYFRDDEEYVEAKLTAYYSAAKRQRASAKAPWWKPTARRGCYRMDFLLSDDPRYVDDDYPSDDDRTVYLWAPEAPPPSTAFPAVICPSDRVRVKQEASEDERSQFSSEDDQPREASENEKPQEANEGEHPHEQEASGVRSFLAACKLDAYADAFDSCGYDDVDDLLEIADDDAELSQLTTIVGFKPGHALKFKLALRGMRRVNETRDSLPCHQSRYVSPIS